MKAMIFAAGFGKRMGTHTLDAPKALLPLYGKPVMDHILNGLPKIEELVVNTHYLPESIQRYFEAKELDFPVRLLHEPEILGTGGGLQNAMFFLKNTDFIVHNCDLILNLNWEEFLSQPKNGADVLLFCAEGKEGRGLFFDESGNLLGRYSPVASLAEKKGNEIRKTLGDYCGVAFFSRRAGDFFRQGSYGHESLVDSFLEMAKAGLKIKSHSVGQGQWLEIGTREQYETAGNLDMERRQTFFKSFDDAL